MTSLASLSPDAKSSPGDWSADAACSFTAQASNDWLAALQGANASAGQSGMANKPPARNEQDAFSGTLLDKRYDETIQNTHCTYSIPVAPYSFTREFRGHFACPDTMTVPPGFV